MEQKDLMFVNPPMPKIEKQVIISVGREFGSGGHEIATRIAKTFNLPLYDHNILREVSEEKGDQYCVYRFYGLSSTAKEIRYYECRGAIKDNFTLEATAFKAYYKG